MSVRGRTAAVVAAAALGVAVAAAGDVAAEPASRAPTADPFARVRGMTISCPGAGLEWGTDDMVRTMEILRDLGCNWVTIHPYGGIRNDGTVGRSRIDGLYRDPRWLTRAIEEAHRLGLKMMIKPHLAYWGSGFSWRGDIHFETDEEWDRFFTTYEEWIVLVAGLSAEADAFVVGTELDQTTGHVDRWERIIAAVRRETEAPLTFSAGWDTYRAVPFWDRLDAVGIQGYFPLVDHDGPPTEAEIAAGWDRIIGELQEFGRAVGRDVVLGELGYPRSRAAALRPWSYEEEAGAEALDLQRRCLATALSALRDSGPVVGAFLWKWFPGEVPRGNFRMSSPELRAVIHREWAAAR